MAPLLDPELKYWLGFNLVKGIGPARVQALLDHFGTLESAWHADHFQLAGVGLQRRALEALLSARANLDLDREHERLQKNDIKLLTWRSENYPRYLREIYNSPPLLYVHGDLEEADQWAIAVVGTRRLTTYGRQVTRDLVGGLVRNRITIVSGLARGIDAIAHKAALEVGGRTIAVLGSGLDRLYPAENRSIAAKIRAGSGAIVTEYGLGVEPDARNFPPRNRIISGLSLGTLVIEAGERSGALITAEFAVEHNRDVFAVPGNINSPASKGTNRLIQRGAKLVRTVDDILEELHLTRVEEHIAVQHAAPATDEEAVLLSYLTHQPLHIDDLTSEAGLPSSLVSSTLAIMELKGMVVQVGGMNYVLAREPGEAYQA